METILKSRKGECFLCGKYGPTEVHHIFYGSGRRKISDREGLIVYLCSECHRGTKGVHGRDGGQLGDRLKRIAQEAWEKRFIQLEYPYRLHAEDAAREAFIRMMGRNYL